MLLPVLQLSYMNCTLRDIVSCTLSLCYSKQYSFPCVFNNKKYKLKVFNLLVYDVRFIYHSRVAS